MKKAASSHPLRIARTRYNLTIEQLAREANVSAATIWRAEHNYLINAESRRRLCTYFDRTPLDLGLLENTFVQEASPLVGQKKAVQPEPASAFSLPGVSAAPSLGNRVETQHLSLPIRQAAALYESGAGRSEEIQGQPDLWLLLSASHLSSLFEGDWTPDALLEALRILLHCIISIPVSLRTGFLQSGVSQAMGPKHGLTAQERFYMQQGFNDGIRRAWQFYHVARPVEVLAVSRALQMLLQYVRPLMLDNVYASSYASVQNLVGGALYLLDQVEAAERVHEQAFQAAKEAHDYQNQVQSRNWQAVDANRRGKYLQAIRYIEDALNLIEAHDQPDLFCSKAHLMANWAFNAAHLQEFAVVEEKLAASAELLEYPNPEGEFDQAIWYQIAGNCLLLNGHYTRAIDHFHRSLSLLSLPWRTRRTLSLIPLAEAHARKRDKEASLAVATEAATTVHAVNSTMLIRHFLEYRQVLIETFPRDQEVRSFIAHVLPQLHGRALG